MFLLININNPTPGFKNPAMLERSLIYHANDLTRTTKKKR